MLIDKAAEIDRLDWSKSDGLLPAIVQDAFDGRVLMQAWVSREALAETLEKSLATFWSRSRETLWTKGETSGNFLSVDSIHADCDRDCVLILARPHGPTCHTGSETCFDDEQAVIPALGFLAELERVIEQRSREGGDESYTARLLSEGVKRIAQKVGEEGVETALAGATGDEAEVCSEAADLLYHLLVLLRARDIAVSSVLKVLAERHR